ncbi:hypothetical protein pb186bvf_016380 [Paramecium bursaria]
MKYWIVLLAVVAFAQYEENYLQQIAQSDFGKTILQTIQVELQGNSSIDHILQLLEQLKTEINDEQDREREKSREHTQFCIDKFNEILFVIDKAGLQLARDQTQLPLALEEQKDKQRQSQDKEDQENRNNQRIQELTDERTASRREYEDRRDEQTTLIGVLREARKTFTKLSTKKYDPLAGTYSFLEISEPILVQLKKYSKQFSHGYGAMFDMLVEISQQPGIQADQKGVAKIQEIIDELIESVYHVQRQELLAENVREQDFQNKKERIVLANRKLIATIALLKAKVEIITQTVLELNNDITNNSNLSRLKAQEKNDWQKACLDYHNGYVAATQIRTNESDILTEVIQIFTRKYDDLAVFIQRMKL